MGVAMNYNDFAKVYAATRTAVPWILEPLSEEVSRFPEGGTILEIGCGTGNYVIALSKKLPGYTYEGFDLSDEMLKIAVTRSNKVRFTKSNADIDFPYVDQTFDFAFAVDVIHHITQYGLFFSECFRVLRQNGSFIIVTDSEEDIKSRSGTAFFPETLQIELDRYPKLQELNSFASHAGFKLEYTKNSKGSFVIDDDFISRVRNKFSSSMRLMKDEDHKKGVERLIEAKERDEKWISSYTFIKYRKKLNK